MVRQPKSKVRIVTKQIWTRSFKENMRRLLVALGYTSHEQTIVESVTIETPSGTQIFKPELGKYVSMAYVEYCNYIIRSTYLLDGPRRLHDIRKDAALFFAELWNEGHGGFVTALIQATDISIKLKARG